MPGKTFQNYHSELHVWRCLWGRFRSSFFIDMDLYYVHGQWDRTTALEMSNYRELSNLIHANSKGPLKDTALFVFTDNFVAKIHFSQGHWINVDSMQTTNASRSLSAHDTCLWKTKDSQGYWWPVKRPDDHGCDDRFKYVKLCSIASWCFGKTRPDTKGLDSELVLDQAEILRTQRLVVWRQYLLNLHLVTSPGCCWSCLEQLAYSIHKHPYRCH